MSLEQEEFNWKELVDVAVKAAKLAGAKIKQAYVQDRSNSIIEDKTVDNIDLVTDTDKACEEMIFGILRSHYPDHEFVGEETSSVEGGYSLSDSPTWIVDPIDGTTNFVHRNARVCVSIGFSVKKKAVVGVIYDPIIDELFTAYIGGGAYVNGQRLHVHDEPTQLDQIIVSTNIGYQRGEIAVNHMMGTITNLMKANLRALRMDGSACLQIISVARGSTNCFYECGPHPWDVCAGAIILQEAGGYMCDLNGEAFDLCSRHYLFACNEAIANLILKHVQKPLLFSGNEE
eukprot:m.11746 g.11746  ORF g.11746 m.11746 type:complete len:288 (-) comp3881_c0_seq1:94-957(-)